MKSYAVCMREGCFAVHSQRMQYVEFETSVVTLSCHVC